MKNAFLILVSILIAPLLFGQNISKKNLDSLIKHSKETNSYSLVIIKDNKPLVEEYYGKEQSPVYLSSVSKIIVSIGIVKLLNDGKITSLDQPVSDFFPEWKQGKKRLITIKMLLNHTSGLQNEMNAGLELEPPPNYKVKNVISLALAAELSSQPGEVMKYNNKAIALLGGIIEKASGKRMDTYFEEEFYKHMDITEFDWIKDESGNPTAHGAFLLKGRDLAKFGQLMINKGQYKNKRFFAENWFDSSVIASQKLDERMGLIWWAYAKDNKWHIDEEQINKLNNVRLSPPVYQQFESLFGKYFNSRDEYFKELENKFGKDWRMFGDSIFKGKSIDFYTLPKVKKGKTLGYYHTGFGGNCLVIIPDLNLVITRTVKRDKNYNYSRDSFHDFLDEAFKLIE